MKKSGHNPYRVLKAVVDMMKQRYISKEYDPLSLEEILTAVNFTDLRTDIREWLHKVREQRARAISSFAFSGVYEVGSNKMHRSFLCSLVPRLWPRFRRLQYERRVSLETRLFLCW